MGGRSRHGLEHRIGAQQNPFRRLNSSAWHDISGAEVGVVVVRDAEFRLRRRAPKQGGFFGYFSATVSRIARVHRRRISRVRSPSGPSSRGRQHAQSGGCRWGVDGLGDLHNLIRHTARSIVRPAPRAKRCQLVPVQRANSRRWRGVRPERDGYPDGRILKAGRHWLEPFPFLGPKSSAACRQRAL